MSKILGQMCVSTTHQPHSKPLPLDPNPCVRMLLMYSQNIIVNKIYYSYLQVKFGEFCF